MSKTIILPIKGLHFYQAENCWQKNLLSPRQPLSLELEPLNKQDAYAVQVWLKEPHALLGYIPRTHSKWVYFLTHNQHIQSTTLLEISKDCHPLKINLILEYQFPWWSALRFRFLHLFK